MKLSLDALKERAEAVASEELLGTISGGLEEACHDGPSNSDVLEWTLKLIYGGMGGYH